MTVRQLRLRSDATARELRAALGQATGARIGVIITDHNVRETLGICDRAYIINEGSILESGPPDVIVKSETARAALSRWGLALIVPGMGAAAVAVNELAPMIEQMAPGIPNARWR